MDVWIFSRNSEIDYENKRLIETFTKKNITSKVVEPSYFDIIVNTNIKNSLKSIELEFKRAKKLPIKFKEFGFTNSMLEYLSNYSKGVFEFESPKPFSIELNNDIFHKLFDLYIDDSKDTFSTISFSKTVNKYLKHPGFNKVDKKYKIAESIINTYAPHSVDIIGKNGSLIVCKTIDFNGKTDSIDKNLIEFEKITLSLKKFSKKLELPNVGTYNIYFDSPKNSDGKKFLDKVQYHNHRK